MWLIKKLIGCANEKALHYVTFLCGNNNWTQEISIFRAKYN